MPIAAQDMPPETQALPEAPAETKSQFTAGLQGVWLKLANISAVGLIMVVFYTDRHAALDAMKDDRAIFREESKANRQAIQDMGESMKEMAVQLRHIVSRQLKADKEK